MADATQRLRRYLDDELEECRDEDVDQRLDELTALETAIGEARVDAELDVLSALASETRYSLVRALVADGDELCVCELDALVDVSESGLSHALSLRLRAGRARRRLRERAEPRALSAGRRRPRRRPEGRPLEEVPGDEPRGRARHCPRRERDRR